MRRTLVLAALAAIGAATPARAQPAAAPAAAPASACTPEHATMGHCTLRAPPPAAQPPANACTPEHAAMGHCTPAKAAEPAPPLPAPTPPAGDPNCPPEHAAMGHCTPAPSAGAAASAPPVAPPSAIARSGHEQAADRVWDPRAMAAVRAAVYAEHGRFRGSKVMIDRLEYRAVDGRDGYAWEGDAWYGGDYDKLWLKTEGEGSFGDALEAAEVQALFSRALDPWFNLQAGVRYDIRPKPDRAHLAVGVQGLAPYWFEVDVAAFVSDKGDVTVRLEAEYDQRLTNRLILQPRVELDLAAQDVPELGIGAGLSSLEAGVRLRYEIVPEFAPYVGVEYERRFGDTADFARAEGEDAGGWAVLAGLRAWF